MDKRGCLFDLDGVIIDSESQYTAFWDNIEKIYPTGITNFSMKIKGSNLSAIMQNYYHDEAIKHDILQRLEAFENSMKLDIFPGAEDFLKELQAAAIPCAIVTSSSQAKMEQLLKQHPGLKNYFVGIINGDMVARPKPDPECYIKGADMIGIAPAGCTVFEDSINGLKAGKQSGAYVVALATTLPAESLKTMEPDMIIPSFAGFHINMLPHLGLQSQNSV